jgi:hypothetical protein
MPQTANADRARGWVIDYSAAIAKAIEWLGDRYLLARPINQSARGDHRQAGRPRLSQSTDRDPSAR